MGQGPAEHRPLGCFLKVWDDLVYRTLKQGSGELGLGEATSQEFKFVTLAWALPKRKLLTCER